MGSAIGSIAGTVLGSTVGGPLGGQIGGAIGGSLFGGSKGGSAGGGYNYVGLTPEEIRQQTMPWSGGGSGGTVSFADGTFSYGMSPQQQALYDATQNYLNQYRSQMGGVADQLGQYGGYQMGLGQGIMGSYAGADPLLSSAAGGLLSRAAQQAGAISGYTPEELAVDLYSRYYEPQLQKQQEREQLATEARLLSQGRLGSTGGGIQQEALTAGQQSARNELMANIYNQAQAIRDQELQRQLTDIATAEGLFGGIFGRGQTALQAGAQGYGAQGDLYNTMMQGSLAGLGLQRGLLMDPLKSAQLGADIGLGIGGVMSQFKPAAQPVQPSLAESLGTKFAPQIASGLGGLFSGGGGYTNAYEGYGGYDGYVDSGMAWEDATYI